MALTDSNKKKNYTNITNGNMQVAEAKIIKFPSHDLEVALFLSIFI